MSLKLQIVSDLHIEFTKSPARNWSKIIKPSADYLCLLGDICPLNEKNRIRHFLLKVCPQFKRVFYIHGNHEFFSYSKRRTITDLSAWFRTWCNQNIPNLTILDNQVIELEGFIIVGTTLWSRIPKKYTKYVVESRNDYRSIAVEGKDGPNNWFKVADNNRLHEKAVRFVFDCVTAAEEAKKPVIILSHHAPMTLNTSNPIYNGDRLNCTHSTDLSTLMKPYVKLWAFGHTHWPTDYMCEQTRIYSNPRGYNDGTDPCSENYDPSAVVEITV